MDFDSLKYAELRSLAKELGLKANQKADKLLKAIKQHYQQEKTQTDETQGHDKDVTDDGQSDAGATQDDVRENEDAPLNKDSSVIAAFVCTRRGRRTRTKRKVSDVAAVAGGDANLHSSAAAEGDAEVAVSGAPCGAMPAKKRRASSARDRENSERGATGGEEQRSDVKDEAPVPGDKENEPRVSRAGKIPRYQGLQQRNKPPLKSVTPNFKKLHEAHFKKMESIDSYVQRKKKQLETYSSSVKDLKQLLDKIKPADVDGKTQVKVNRASMFSPVPANKRAAEDKCRQTLPPARAPPNKSARKEDAVFRPSVLSTRRINVRFSEATRDNEYKRSMTKTPARMSPCVTSSTPLKQTADGGKPNNVKSSTFSATKTPGPFVFTGNTSTSVTPGTQNKSKFDLKASLSRPLTYRPHTGKLKPFGGTKENAAVNKSLNSTTTHQDNYKKHQVQTREDRRTKLADNRKQKKENMLGARRGLVMM